MLGAGFRPLKALHFALILLGPGLLAGLLAREALGSGAEVRRRHLLMASLGFAFYPTAFGLHLFVPNLMNVPAVEAWIGALGLVPVLYVVWQFARAARPVAGEGLRSSARKYLGILSLSPISVVGLAVAEATLPLDEARASMRWVMTLWLVVLLLLVGYAILRHQLFGIELGVKWTLRRGTVPALLVAAFFVVTELTQNFASALGGVWTWVVAGGVVGVIAIGYLPLQRAANRLAEAAMPEVGNTPRYTSLRRRQLYGSALAAAWEDGFLTRVERLRLDRLRERLQLTAQDAGSLESEFVERRVGTGPKR